MQTELLAKRDELLRELKEVRLKLKGNAKYPLPDDGQIIWVICKKGRRFKATYYEKDSPIAPKFSGEKDSVGWWNEFYQKNYNRYLVPHPIGKFHIIRFKFNHHAPNGGWEPFPD